MKYYGPRGRDKRGRLIFFLLSIQRWFRALTAKTDARITVRKFGNRAKRRAKTAIMTYCSAANLRETVELRAKHHPTTNKYNIWFWWCVFTFGCFREISRAVFFKTLIRGLSTRDSALWLKQGTTSWKFWGDVVAMVDKLQAPPLTSASGATFTSDSPSSSKQFNHLRRRVEKSSDCSRRLLLTSMCQSQLWLPKKKKKAAFTSKESVSASDGSEVSTHRVQCCRQWRRFQTILPFCDSMILWF